MDLNGWRIAPQTLRFRAGEITLFSRTLELAISEADFTELPDDPDATRLPRELLALGVAGAVIYSHPAPAPLARISARHGTIRYVPNQYERRTISLGGRFDEYLARFSPKTRSGLGRKVRRFAKLSGGSTDVHWYRTPAEVDRFMKVAGPLATRTYQARLLGTALPSNDAFRAGLRALAAEQRFYGTVLFLRGEAVAYFCLPVHGRTVRCDHLGYEPSLAEYSPGTVLFYLTLEGLFAERGLAWFDFGEGDGAHKLMFSTHAKRCADLYYLRDTIEHRALVYAHAGLDLASSRAGDLLERVGLEGRIKAALRRRT